MNEKKSTDLNILVVDDEEDIRILFKDILTLPGYNVWTASGGLEAINMMKEADFNIVLTDMRMPGMDGLEVTKKLKEINSDITVIAISGYSSKESAMALLKEGAYDYITKPVDINEVRIIVKRAAERYRLLSEVKEKDVYKNLAIHDGLTEIYNRRYFNQTVPRELERAKRYKNPLSFLMVDIDYFKKFNDTQGHLAGDWALKRISQVLMGSIRIPDMVLRYGGEEFAVVLPETNKSNAIVVAERIRTNVSVTRFLDSGFIPTQHLTVSIGVCTFPVDAQNLQEVIENADKHLYSAKRLGRDRICFSSEEKEVENR
ncbi:MAG: diguanylate cyclase [Deltaproteobacteria bacterium]|nr:diguanylate cyclase [Deltaproteobacteria bacterium]